MKIGFCILVVVTLFLGSCSIPFFFHTHTYDFREAHESCDETRVAVRLDKSRAITRHIFYAIDKNGEEHIIILSGKTLPDGFSESNQLTLLGTFHGGCFYTREVLMKCVCHYNTNRS